MPDIKNNEKSFVFFKKIAKYILITLLILFIGLIYVLYNPPSFLVNRITEEAQLQISDITQLNTSLGKISTLRIGIINQKAVVEGIKILKDKNLKAPVFIKAEKIEIGFNLLSFLFFGMDKSTLNVNIVDPFIDIKRDKKGNFDINSPLFKPSKEKQEPQGKIVLPEIILGIQNGTVKYTDQGLPKQIDLYLKISTLKANLTKSSNLDFNALLLEQNDSVKLKGNFNIVSGQGNINSDVKVRDISRWLKVFNDPSETGVFINKGELHTAVNAEWKNFKFQEMKFNAKIDGKNIFGKFPLYNSPVNIEKISANIDKHFADFNDFLLYTQGAKISGNLKGKYNGKNAFLKANISADKLELNKLFASLDKSLIPQSVIDLNISGITKTNLVIEGTFGKINEKTPFISYPETFDLNLIKGKAFLTQAHIMNSDIKSMKTDFLLNGKNIKITNIYTEMYSGIAKGNVEIKELFKGKIGPADLKKAFFDGSFKTENIDLDTIIKDFDVTIPKEYKPSAKINSNFKMTGNILEPEITGKFLLPLITFDSRYSKINPIPNVSSDIFYSKNLIKAKANINSNDFGNSIVDFSLENLDKINVKTISKNLLSKTVGAFVPQFTSNKGLIEGTTSTSFSLKQFKKEYKPEMESITKVFNIDGDLTFKDTDINYLYSKKILSSESTNGRVTLKIDRNNIISDFDIYSNQIGKAKGNLQLNRLNLLKTNFDVKNLSLETIRPFISSIDIKKGYADFSGDLVMSLNALKKDDFLKYIRGRANLSLDNALFSYLYKTKKINFTDTSAKLALQTNNGNLSSKIILVSKETGKINYVMAIKNNDVITSDFIIDNLPVKTLNPFVSSMKIESGNAEIKGDLNTNMKSIFSGKLFDKLSSDILINITNGNFNFNGKSGNIFKITDMNGNIDTGIRNKDISSKINLTSNELGSTLVKFSLKNFNHLEASVLTKDTIVKTLENIIPDLKVRSGTGNISAKIVTDIDKFSNKLTLDKLTYILKTEGNITFKNTNITYTRKKASALDITNGEMDVSFNVNDGIVYSDFLFNSKEFGIAKGSLRVDKERYLDGTLSNTNFDMRNFKNLIPGITIDKGLGVVDVVVWGNLKDFTKNPEAITVKGVFDINDFSGKYSGKSKSLPIEISNFHSSFTYNKGAVLSEMSLNSPQIGKINAGFNMNHETDIKGKVYSSNLKLDYLNNFLSPDDLKIKEGTGNLDVIFSGNLLKDLSSFQVSGEIGVNILNSIFTVSDDEMKENKPSNPDILLTSDTSKLPPVSETGDVITSEPISTNLKTKQIEQKLETGKITFNLKNNKLEISQLLLKNPNSLLTGKSYFDFSENKNNKNLGTLSLNSDSLSIKDFPIAELAGFKDGNFKQIRIEADLSQNYMDSSATINFDLRNILMTNDSKFNSFISSIDYKNNVLKINRFNINNSESYFDTKGNVNLTSTENPDFNIMINSRKFKIKSLLSLLPENLIKRFQKVKPTILSKTKNVVIYTLPGGNNFSRIKTKSINLDSLIQYWEKWALEPMNEQNQVEKKPSLWNSVDGDISTNITIAGNLKNPEVDANLLLNNATVYGINFSEVYLDGNYKNKNLNLAKVYVIETEGGFLKLSGNLDSNSNIAFEGDGKVNLRWIKPFMKNPSEIEGFAVVATDVKGTVSDPEITLSIDANTGGVFSDTYFDTFSILGTYKDKVVNIADAKISSGGKEANAAGIIPIDEKNGSMNVSMSLSGESLGLINLITHQIEWMKGEGDVFLNLQGSFSDPLINGKINILNGEMFVPSLNKTLEKLNVDIDISNHFVRINTAEALLNKSKVELLGQIDLIGFSPGFFKLKLIAEEFIWEEENISLAGKVSLKINNTIDEPLIGGKVLLKRGEMTMALTGSSSKSGSTGKSKKKAGSSIDAQFNNLLIEIPKNTDFWVRSAFFDLKPYGNLNLKKGGLYTPYIDGFVAINEGNLYLLNNEFKVVDAIADFRGKDFEKDISRLNPKLSITADTTFLNPRTRQNASVQAIISGNLEDIPLNKMQIDWTKTGGMTEQEIWTQVIGLSAAQQLLQETGSGTTANTIAKFATPYFNRAIFNPLTSKVADFLALDEFNVGLASDTVTNPGVLISISKPVIWGLSMGYQGIFRSTTLPQYNFFARYRFSDNFSVKSMFDERNAFSVQGEIGWGF